MNNNRARFTTTQYMKSILGFFPFIAVLMYSSSIFSGQLDQNVSHEEVRSLLNRTDCQLEDLDIKIKCFLDRKDANTLANETFLKEVGAWEEAFQGDADFKENFAKLQEEFLVFRGYLSHVVGGIYGSCAYSRILQAISVMQVTEWYIDYLEKRIFQEQSEDKTNIKPKLGKEIP